MSEHTTLVDRIHNRLERREPVIDTQEGLLLEAINSIALLTVERDGLRSGLEQLLNDKHVTYAVRVTRAREALASTAPLP